MMEGYYVKHSPAAGHFSCNERPTSRRPTISDPNSDHVVNDGCLCFRDSVVALLDVFEHVFGCCFPLRFASMRVCHPIWLCTLHAFVCVCVSVCLCVSVCVCVCLCVFV